MPIQNFTDTVTNFAQIMTMSKHQTLLTVCVCYGLNHNFFSSVLSIDGGKKSDEKTHLKELYRVIEMICKDFTEYNNREKDPREALRALRELEQFLIEIGNLSFKDMRGKAKLWKRSQRTQTTFQNNDTCIWETLIGITRI
jgi:hypothetical protein